MLDSNESTVVTWENAKSAPSRLTASAREGDRVVAVNVETIENATSLRLTRDDVRELGAFLVAIADDLDTWEDDTEQPQSAASDDEGTVD